MSDQDFFFDDDEKTAAKSDNKAKKAGTPSTSRPAAKTGARPAAAPAAASAQSVTMTMAILFAVIGLLLGVVIGLFIGTTLNPSSATTANSPATVVAPTLTQEQMNAGQLPAGHPKVTGTGASTTATATK